MRGNCFRQLGCTGRIGILSTVFVVAAFGALPAKAGVEARPASSS